MNNQAVSHSTFGTWKGEPGTGHVDMPAEVTAPLKFAGALIFKDRSMRFWCASYKLSPFVQRMTITHALLDTGDRYTAGRTLHHRFTVVGVPFTIFPMDVAPGVTPTEDPTPE